MSTVTMLPLGSIVILKGNTKKMMIIARVIAAPIKGEVYRFDYLGYNRRRAWDIRFTLR
ncbi:TPA: DUF4176 domain-containing protein, partial [Streptococcus equi subsp. zooepidemicus]|nr:DUF4176 domain-containing protein [Streptococcus equi subsp. zooepidemicus]